MIVEKVPEKRTGTRFAVSLGLQYRYLTKLNNALSRDISEGGLSFTTSDFIPLNTKLFVALLPKDEPLRATGEVVWVRKVPFGDRYNVGLKFTDISAYNRARISTLEDRVVRDNF